MSPGHGNSAWAATIRGEILGGKTTSAPAAHAIAAELPDIQKRSVAAGTQKFPDVAHSLTKADIVAKLMFNASNIDVADRPAYFQLVSLNVASLLARLNLETAVGRACWCVWAGVWREATTRQAHACKAERQSQAPAQAC